MPKPEGRACQLPPPIPSQARTCPCCGGRMIIIETFERGATPRHRPTASTDRHQDRHLMTASQSRKSARRARWLSTGHGRARSDIQPSSQIVRQFTALDADPPLMHQPLHRRPDLLDRLDSNHTPHPRHSNPHSACRATYVPPPAVSLYGAFFVKEFARAAHLFSFVSFFVRSQSPFLRPDPRFADVVARRSCQGWPSRQPCGMLRACQAIP